MLTWAAAAAAECTVIVPVRPISLAGHLPRLASVHATAVGRRRGGLRGRGRVDGCVGGGRVSGGRALVWAYGRRRTRCCSK